MLPPSLLILILCFGINTNLIKIDTNTNTEVFCQISTDTNITLNKQYCICSALQRRHLNDINQYYNYLTSSDSITLNPTRLNATQVDRLWFRSTIHTLSFRMSVPFGTMVQYSWMQSSHHQTASRQLYRAEVPPPSRFGMRPWRRQPA